MSTMSTNPFTPGSGTYPPYLAGRDSHLTSFSSMLKDIENGHIENRLVVGLRGTGKSVLLEEFNKICLKNQFLPIRRSQFSRKHCDPTEFTKAIKYDVRTAIESFSKIGKFKGTIAAIGSFLKPKTVGVPDLFYYEPSYDSTSRVPLEDHLREYFVKNWEVFEKSNFKGVIFLYDEFHSVYDVPGNKWFVITDFIGVINEIQKQKCKYFFILAGLPNLQLNITESKTYTERMFKSINVENLSNEEAKKAITKPLEKTNYKFAENLVNKIVNDTGQYPYFIQFYCKELINNIEKENISLDDYNRVYPVILKQLEDDFFEPRMDRLGDDEKKVLIAMSKSDKIDIPFNFIQEKSKIEKSSISKHLQRLEEKGMAYNFKRGIYRFSVPQLKEYLIRKS